MNKEFMAMRDLETFTNKLKNFNWYFENGSIEAVRYGFDMINKFRCAATFSPKHQEVWAGYEKEHVK